MSMVVTPNAAAHERRRQQRRRTADRKRYVLDLLASACSTPLVNKRAIMSTRAYRDLWHSVRGSRSGCFAVPPNLLESAARALSRELRNDRGGGDDALPVPAPIAATGFVPPRLPPVVDFGDFEMEELPSDREEQEQELPPPPPPVIDLSGDATTDEEEEGPECCVCMERKAGARPLLGTDFDTAARCDHAYCTECGEAAFADFLKDPTRAFFECVACRREGRPLLRPHVDRSATYMVDPARHAMDLTPSAVAALDRKGEYLARFLTANVSGADVPVRRDCPACGERDSAVGPLTAERPNLLRCRNRRCLVVSCARCGEVADHAPERCPGAALPTPRAPFEPLLGRKCPHPGCAYGGIQHFRNDGCHIVRCPAGHCFCFCCGALHPGRSQHDVSRRGCACALTCNGRCPCVEDK